MGRILYCAELNVIVIAHDQGVDFETGKLCFPVEWDYNDMFAAQLARSKRLKNMQGSCDLSDLFSWEFVGEFI